MVLPSVGYSIGINTGSMPGQNNNPHNHSDLILGDKEQDDLKNSYSCIYMLRENQTLQLM